MHTKVYTHMHTRTEDETLPLNKQATAFLLESGSKFSNSHYCVNVHDSAVSLTWVVAVMDRTNVGTVEQLRLRRRP